MTRLGAWRRRRGHGFQYIGGSPQLADHLGEAGPRVTIHALGLIRRGREEPLEPAGHKERRHHERGQAIIGVTTTQPSGQQHHLVGQTTGQRNEHSNPAASSAAPAPP